MCKYLHNCLHLFNLSVLQSVMVSFRFLHNAIKYTFRFYGFIDNCNVIWILFQIYCSKMHNEKLIQILLWFYSIFVEALRSTLRISTVEWALKIKVSVEKFPLKILCKLYEYFVEQTEMWRKVGNMKINLIVLPTKV